MKTCKKCHLEKSIVDFNKDSLRKDGHYPYCRTCSSKDKHEYIMSEKGKAYMKRKNLKQKEYMKTYLRDYNRRYPKERKARVMLLNAIRDRRVKKMPCVVCGEVKSEGHHIDYNQPLVVIWLCKKHHRDIHRTLKL